MTERNWNVTGWKVAGTSPGPTWPRNPQVVVSGWKVAGIPRNPPEVVSGWKDAGTPRTRRRL